MKERSRVAAALVLGALFTIGYVATVLPFTVRFFRSYTGVQGDQTLLLIPLETILTYSLPLFLACLELVSISLACVFWLSVSSAPSRATVAFVLFLMCQAYPVAATYLGTEQVEYEAYRAALDDQRGRSAAADVVARAEVDRAITVRTEDLDRLERLRGSVAREIERNRARLASLERIPPLERLDEIAAEIARLGRALDQAQVRQDTYDRQLGALANRSEIVPAAADAARTDGDPPLPTFGAFVADTIGSFRSRIGLAVAALFPLSVLGVTFVMMRTRETYPEGAFGLNLARELQVGSTRPADEQPDYVRLLTPVVKAHFVAMRASKELGFENIAFRLQNDVRAELLAEVSALKQQVFRSGLRPPAKGQLTDCLNQLERQLLTHQEAA